MNILYVVHDNKKGGAALSFLEMVSYISKEHSVLVLLPHKRGFVPQKLDEMKIPYRCAHYFWWKISQPSNLFLATMRLMVYKFLNTWNYVEAKRLCKDIKDMNIDIIHSNSSVINFGALLSEETGIPHIWHLREYGEEDFNLKCVVSTRRYMYEMNSHAVGYIAISKSIKEKFAKIVDEERITQIYNGVSDIFRFEKTFTVEKKDVVKFLIAGNYCKEKGQDDVIKAVVELKRLGIRDFQLYIAGNGSFAEVRHLVKENGLENCVIFCGLVEDMVQLRKAVDVEIVASKCEAFGRVTIEAMRMSNPVIGTNQGGTLELIKEDVTGLVFKYGDYIELANCMKRFIIDKSLLGRMGRSAYVDTKEKYTAKENADKISKLYMKIGRV